MANVPYPLTGESMAEVKSQVYELVRQIFEEKLGGADLGDVFSMPGDVLTLVLYDDSLIKVDNKLAVQLSSIIGGLQVGSDGVSIKVVSTGGLQTSASGASIKCKAGGGASTDVDGLSVAGIGTIDHGGLLGLLDDDHTQYQKESEKDAVSGYAGLNASSRTTKGIDTTDDIIVDLATKGLVLKDTQGTPHYWRVSVSILGVLTTTDLGTSKP